MTGYDMTDKAFTIQEHELYLQITLHKKVNKTHILEMLDELEQLQSTKNRLYLHEQSVDASVDEMREIAEKGKTRSKNISKLAFCCNDITTYGLLRAYEAYREVGVTQTRVFKSEEEARQWLLDGTVLPS